MDSRRTLSRNHTMSCRFLERELSQPYDHWDENHPDENQFVLQLFESGDEPVAEEELLYCAETISSRGEPFQQYRAERDKFIQEHPWIPVEEEGRHHRDGIRHDQRYAAPEGYQRSYGTYYRLDYLIPARPVPIFVFPQIPEQWIRDQKVLSEQLMNLLKSSPTSMRGLRSDVFEQLILELMAGLGYEVQWIGRRPDLSGDGIVLGCLPGGVKIPMLVEAKCYPESRKVSVAQANQLFGAMQRQRFPCAFLVTSSSFTDGVLRKFGNIWGFHLRDFEAVSEWLETYRTVSPLHIDKQPPHQ